MSGKKLVKYFDNIHDLGLFENMFKVQPVIYLF